MGLLPEFSKTVAIIELLIINSMVNISFVSDYPIPPSFALDPVTNMNLDNVKHVYNPGEVITCSAGGNPGPEIRWVDDANVTVSDSATLLIEPFMEGTHLQLLGNKCCESSDV